MQYQQLLVLIVIFFACFADVRRVEGLAHVEVLKGAMAANSYFINLLYSPLRSSVIDKAQSNQENYSINFILFYNF
jgi:hypothetical protein